LPVTIELQLPKSADIADLPEIREASSGSQGLARQMGRRRAGRLSQRAEDGVTLHHAPAPGSGSAVNDREVVGPERYLDGA
jgi:hypothetical protein